MSLATDPAVSADPPVGTPHTDDTDADRELYAGREELLPLPDGRTLAYSHSGPPDSPTVVLWYHGLFSVGDASRPAAVLRRRRVRYLAPSLPGWGRTSPIRPGSTRTFPQTVLADTRAMFARLYPAYEPRASKLRLYVAGGSFGTCPAQVLFGAPYDDSGFPYGRQIVALVLVAPFSPPREDPGFERALGWRDWVGVGWPARVLPGNVLARATKLVLAPRVRTAGGAEALLRGAFFDGMGEGERARFGAWRARNGLGEGEFERRMAEGMVESVSVTWEGFLGTAGAIHADWGFRIRDLDGEHQRKKVVIVVGKGDTSMFAMSRYLVEHYKNNKVFEFEGGHLAGAWSLDSVWEEVLAESDVEL